MPIEPRAAREVRDVDEWPRGACELDAVGDAIAHTARQREGEAHEQSISRTSELTQWSMS